MSYYSIDCVNDIILMSIFFIIYICLKNSACTNYIIFYDHDIYIYTSIHTTCIVVWPYGVYIMCAVCFIKLLSKLYNIVKVKSKSYTTAISVWARVHIIFCEYNVIKNIYYILQTYDVYIFWLRHA